MSLWNSRYVPNRRLETYRSYEERRKRKSLPSVGGRRHSGNFEKWGLRGTSLEPFEAVTVASLLRGGGYATAAFGKTAPLADPLSQGFDGFLGQIDQSTAHNMRETTRPRPGFWHFHSGFGSGTLCLGVARNCGEDRVKSRGGPRDTYRSRLQSDTSRPRLKKPVQLDPVRALSSRERESERCECALSLSLSLFLSEEEEEEGHETQNARLARAKIK